jgi:hypothetical protein
LIGFVLHRHGRPAVAGRIYPGGNEAAYTEEEGHERKGMTIPDIVRGDADEAAAYQEELSPDQTRVIGLRTASRSHVESQSSPSSLSTTTARRRRGFSSTNTTTSGDQDMKRFEIA